MPIVTIHHNSDYTCISNIPINDTRLSLDTLGLLTWLLSKPENWRVNFQGIINAFRKTSRHIGRERLRRMFHEMEQAGYMRRERTQKDDGTFDWTYHIYEIPQTIGGLPTDGLAVGGSSVGGQPADLISTEEINTNSINTEKTLCVFSAGSPTDEIQYVPIEETFEIRGEPRRATYVAAHKDNDVELPTLPVSVKKLFAEIAKAAKKTKLTRKQEIYATRVLAEALQNARDAFGMGEEDFIDYAKNKVEWAALVNKKKKGAAVIKVRQIVDMIAKPENMAKHKAFADADYERKRRLRKVPERLPDIDEILAAIDGM